MNTRDFERIQFRPTDFQVAMKKSTQPDQLISLSDAFNQWIMDCKLENRSPATIRFYRSFTKGFRDKYGTLPISDITPDMTRSYFAESQDGHQFAHASRFRAIRRLFRWAKTMGYVEQSPVTISSPKTPEVIKPTFGQADLDTLERGCTGKFVLRDTAIIMVFRDTGCRLSEMARLKFEHISLEGRLLKFLGKGNKERIVAIRTQTAKAVWRYWQWREQYMGHKTTPLVWISDDRKALTKDGIELIVQRLGKRLGIANCHPHTFRHTFAQTFLENGGNPLDLQYLLGHTTLDMVRRYSRFQEQQRAIQAQQRMFSN